MLYHAAHRSERLLWVLLVWLLVQGGLAGSGFHAVTNTVPPRLVLALVPALLAIAGLACTARGRRFMAGLRLDSLTLLHVVRIPVELVLFGLFVQGAVPQLMTFKGRNWDILAGLTAPIVYYLVFRKNGLGTKSLLLWNIVGLRSAGSRRPARRWLADARRCPTRRCRRGFWCSPRPDCGPGTRLRGCFFLARRVLVGL